MTRLIVLPPKSCSRFFAFGQAVPQPRARVAVRGRFAQAYVPREHAIHAWRQSVEMICRQVMRETIRGPVAVCLEIRLERPASHWTSKGELSAAGRRAGEAPGDWDNYAKAIQDAIVDAAGIEDDRQASGPNVVWKRWCERDEEPGVLVVIAPAETVWCTWGAIP